MIQWLEVEMRVHRSLSSPATKQRARPHRCDHEMARAHVSVIVEHTDNDSCEDRCDDKQHHYGDHERPDLRAAFMPRADSVARAGQGGYCAADTAKAPVRSWLKGSPTSTAFLVEG